MDDAQVAAVAALADPMRRRAYEMVCSEQEAVSRDDVAAALGIGRTLAAFHLDKLADLGLLDVAFARRTGRSGPGAGRPAKLYHRADTEVAVQIPPRAYDGLSILLAEALERGGHDELAETVAHDAGVQAGRVAEGAPEEVLRERGYAPVMHDDVILLDNCPFHVVAREFPPLVCGMNLALLRGLAESAGWPCEAVMDPAPGRCCVSLKPSKNN